MVEIKRPCSTLALQAAGWSVGWQWGCSPARRLHDLQLAVAMDRGRSDAFSLTTFANAGLEINMARRAPKQAPSHLGCHHGPICDAIQLKILAGNRL